MVNGVLRTEKRNVRTGGDWETLNKAMKVKKGGEPSSSYCNLMNLACLEMMQANKQTGLTCVIPKEELPTEFTIAYLNTLNKKGKMFYKTLYKNTWLQQFENPENPELAGITEDRLAKLDQITPVKFKKAKGK